MPSIKLDNLKSRPRSDGLGSEDGRPVNERNRPKSAFAWMKLGINGTD